MDGDNYLSPQLKQMLLTLRKARAPYLRLAGLKEIVIYPEKSMHFERVIKPELTAWFRIDWSIEEQIKYAQDPAAFLGNVFSNYRKMGYVVGIPENFPLDKAEELNKVTTPKEKKKLW